MEYGISSELWVRRHAFVFEKPLTVSPLGPRIDDNRDFISREA